MDFATAASQNGICITQEMCHILILFHNCSTITDESKKYVTVWIILAFLMKGKLERAKSVLWCRRLRIHRYVAALSGLWCCICAVGSVAVCTSIEREWAQSYLLPNRLHWLNCVPYLRCSIRFHAESTLYSLHPANQPYKFLGEFPNRNIEGTGSRDEVDFLLKLIARSRL